jgi:hypothetical protein
MEELGKNKKILSPDSKSAGQDLNSGIPEHEVRDRGG